MEEYLRFWRYLITADCTWSETPENECSHWEYWSSVENWSRFLHVLPEVDAAAPEAGGEPNAADGGKGCEGNCTVVVTRVGVPVGFMEIFAVVGTSLGFLATGDDMPKPVLIWRWGGRDTPRRCHNMSLEWLHLKITFDTISSRIITSAIHSKSCRPCSAESSPLNKTGRQQTPEADQWSRKYERRLIWCFEGLQFLVQEVKSFVPTISRTLKRISRSF